MTGMFDHRERRTAQKYDGPTPSSVSANFAASGRSPLATGAGYGVSSYDCCFCRAGYSGAFQRRSGLFGVRPESFSMYGMDDHHPGGGGGSLVSPSWRSAHFAAHSQLGWPLSMTLADLHDDTLLPTGLGNDPRQWSKHNVSMWLEWCTEQFSLVPTDSENFHMNGKALCLLSKADFLERAPKAGDVLFNALQLLLHRALHTARLTNGTHGNGSVPRNTVITRDIQGFGQVLLQDPTSYNQVSPLSAEVDSTVILSPDPSSGGESVQGDSAGMQAGSSTPSSNGGGTGSAKNSSPPPSLVATPMLVDKQGVMDLVRRSPTPPTQVVFPPRGGMSAFPGMLPDVALHSMMPPVAAKPPQLPPPVALNVPPVTPPATGRVVADAPGDKMSVRLLWDFLQQLLNDPEQKYRYCITWKDQAKGVFKITDPHRLAKLWGMQKNHLNMNFDKMSRAMRYYYRVKILQKEPGERLCYRFLRPPTELRYCKQRSLLERTVSDAAAAREGEEEEASSALDMSIKEECLSPCIEND
ncbi:ets DNA-binding protein pokkuri-like isoform X2 [Dermacentor silvarum]|uniref:ets DNA-binding protein pokkuri-like isoform X2 n=1 Tax=Dermacentor silvarum TaxID=543639 RepID=UPI002100D495|nr:ets DNA-binding protein pokkuri-like isoform X2 [Dermacentor silvarum]